MNSVKGKAFRQIENGTGSKHGHTQGGESMGNGGYTGLIHKIIFLFQTS